MRDAARPASFIGRRLEPRGHEGEELSGGEVERSPVEIVMGQEPDLLLPASAGETHADNGRVCGTGRLST